MPPGDVMESLPKSTNSGWLFPFVQQDWEHTPAALQVYVHKLQDKLTQLRERVEALEARRAQHSTTSRRKLSSDALYKKPCQYTFSPNTSEGKPGHPDHRQAFLFSTNFTVTKLYY